MVESSRQVVHVERQTVRFVGLRCGLDQPRPGAGAALGDQKRVATPARAIADGADHIVVGRPIWQDPDPRRAAMAIQAELGTA